MNILIDAGHPAHIHYYRNLSSLLSARGHKVIWTIKESRIIRQLLDYYGINYYALPPRKDGILHKAWAQVRYNQKLYQVCKRENIEIAIGTSINIAHVSSFTSVKSVFFEDDDDKVVPLSAIAGHPFADVVISPDCLKSKQRRKNVVYYPGYHELAYLHPNRFTPDPGVLTELGVSEKEPYFVMRFNVFKAHHDRGAKGLSLNQKLQLVNTLKKFGQIFITTERNIEPELKKYQMRISPEKAHSLMAFSKMFIGDSQTMTSEASCLGVPSFRCNTFVGRIAYLQEQESKYGLTCGFLPSEFDKMLLKINELLAMPDLAQIWQQRRLAMLSQKIDVTAFWLWFIENYPRSVNLMSDSPLFWSKF